MVERTYPQVMPVFGVPRDPLQEHSCSKMILDNPNYTTGSFDGFITEDTDYFTWFLQSLARPVMDDCPVSGGKVVDGKARARQALESHLRLHVDTLQARVRDLEGASAVREGYIQEEIARSQARERDLWQREREGHVVATKRERRVNSRLR